MEETITYLIGAGASRNALPLVEEIPNSLVDFHTEFTNNIFALSNTEYFDGLNNEKTKCGYQNELFESIEWMKKGASEHASIDIFAKKLYATKQYSLFLKLKATLTCYFIFLQIKNKIDNRYDSFIAALINPERTIDNLPSNLKILSWNYDFQFEKAYSAYSRSNSLHDNQSRLDTRPSEVNGITPSNNFSIFKLNGTTGVHNVTWRNVEGIVDDLNHKIDKTFIESLVKSYAGFTRHSPVFRPLLTFAWETEPISRKVIEEAMLATKDTKVLVVIGYSFPFFNRIVDRKIIRGMEKLEKIYFQAPGREAHNYLDRFQAIRNDYDKLKLIPIEDVAQFFLPPEL